MQFLSSRNNNQKTPWMSTPEYYSNESGDADYIDTKSRSRNSTTDMCVEKNTEGKPPYSYATLIKYAIERSSENKLTLSQIYQWVIDHYPYYGSAGSGWKNSIRHNLSLNKSFVRVPRPVNEPGKGSYWTVDQYAIDSEQRVRTNVRGRSNRSSSDSSLHHRASEPWLLVNRNYRDGRSQSADAGVTSSSAAAALRRTPQYGYCSHPYGGYTPPQHNYYGRQQQHQHQHSSVTYSLPATATAATTNSNHNIPFYSHRQSCPDLSSTYSETIPNFNTAGNEVCLESPSASGMCDNKMVYTAPFYSKVFAPAKGRSTLAGLPSPVLSPSNCSSTTSSQHLSVADPLSSLVTQHPSPVTGTETPNNNRMPSPYYKSMEEPSSPLHMISPRTRSPVPFFNTEAVAYIDMVSQHQNASPQSSHSSQSPHQFAASTNPFLSQTERFDYSL